MVKSGGISPIHGFIIERIAKIDPFTIRKVKKAEQTQQPESRC
jgi:hypothetical protein